MEKEADELTAMLQQPKQAAKAKPAAKRKRGDAPSSPQSRAQKEKVEDSGEEKRCKSCRKKKALTSFYQSQAVCKECSHAKKNITKMAKAQKEEAWLATLSESEMEQLSKAYMKEKEKAEREHGRVRFQLKRYKETVKAATGLRAEARRRFMNEAQYMKFAQSDDGGNY